MARNTISGFNLEAERMVIGQRITHIKVSGLEPKVVITLEDETTLEFAGGSFSSMAGLTSTIKSNEEVLAVTTTTE